MKKQISLKLIKPESGVWAGPFKFFEDSNGSRITLFENKKFDLYIGKNSTTFENTECYKLISTSIDDSGEYWNFEQADIQKNDNGYIEVITPVKTEYFHRMVVYAFGDKYGKHQSGSEYTEIDHVSGEKERNIPENLEIVPPIINSYRAWEHGYSSGRDYFIEKLSNISSLKDFKETITTLYNEMNEENKK